MFYCWTNITRETNGNENEVLLIKQADYNQFPVGNNVGDLHSSPGLSSINPVGERKI